MRPTTEKDPRMNIDNLTIGEAMQIAEMVGGGKNPDDTHWKIGKCYLIRTVTMVQTGRLVKVCPQELVLEDAAWIADTGRFADALISSEFNEVEPFPPGPVIIGRQSIIDAVQIKDAPRVQR